MDKTCLFLGKYFIKFSTSLYVTGQFKFYTFQSWKTV